MSKFTLFDTEKITKSILHDVAAKHKVEIHCPQCDLNLGKYTPNEMRNIAKVYCENCKVDVVFNVDDDLV